MRAQIALLCVAALTLAPFAPAAAEPEPDNALWEATGPVQTDTITGTLSSAEDIDWYLLNVAANTQLTATLQPSCKYQEATLADADGQSIATLKGSETLPNSTTYVVGATNTQLLLRVRGFSLCAGSTYTITLSPSSALLPGSPMPAATPLGEPNESPQQAVGPLTGDVWYSGDLVAADDKDFYSFYADASVTVKAVTSRCGISAILGEDGGDPDVAVAEVGSSRYAQMAHTPTTWKKFQVSFSVGYSDPTCVYRFLITPASAVKSGPRPLTPPTTKVQGLTYKRVGKRVIVRWKAVAGATGYESRFRYLNKYADWTLYPKTQRSFRVRMVPKKGMKVQVRARNDDGAGPKATIRVRV
jgi:hypothetical protein